MSNDPLNRSPHPSEYDAIAEWYADSVLDSPIHAIVVPSLMKIAGNVERLKVCDLCCGEGVAGREFSASGAIVTGADLSEKLIEIARERARNESLAISYQIGDAQSLENFEDAEFDLVVCCLALMDLPDIDACFRAVWRILKPDGLFVFAIAHPCYQTPESRWTGKSGGVVKREVRAYFNEGEWLSANRGSVRGKTLSYHRTLSSYLNALAEAGFYLQRLDEPRPENETGNRVPGYKEVPVALVARCGKRPRSH